MHTTHHTTPRHHSTQDLVIMYNITIIIICNGASGEGGRERGLAWWQLHGCSPASSCDAGGQRIASKLAVTRIVEDTVPGVGVGCSPQQRNCLTLWAALHNR